MVDQKKVKYQLPSTLAKMQEELKKAKSELAIFRLSRHSKKEKNVHFGRELGKKIARLLTAIKEKELGA